jgi:hypothetical protein
MAHTQVINAVSGRLAALWSLCPVQIEPAGPQPPPRDGSLFLAVEFHSSYSRQATIGSPGANIYRDEGAIRFVLHVPNSTGYRAGSEQCQILAGLFRGQQFDGVETFAPSPASVDRSRTGGNYLALAFVVPFKFDFTA